MVEMVSLSFVNFSLVFFLFRFVISIHHVETIEFQNPSNIIVIIADDLGWNDVSFHGSNEIPTPNIDSLAYNGVILNKHYVLPTCTPSRSALFTGRYPIRDDMQGPPSSPGVPQELPLSTRLLPEHLKKLGYSTRLIGKWHLGYQSNDFTPAKRGFDTFFGFYNGVLNYFSHENAYKGISGYDLHRDSPTEMKPDWARQNESSIDIFTDEAMKIIEEHDSHRPLYLQLSYAAPHGGASWNQQFDIQNGAAARKDLDYIGDWERRMFGGKVAALDESVGRVMKSL